MSLDSGRVDVLGCAVDRVTLDDAVERCLAVIADGKELMQFSVNAAKVVAMRSDPDLAAIGRGAGLVTADGSSIVLAARLFGEPLPERVTGIDLMERLLAAAERDRLPVYLLGATPEMLDLALDAIRARHPELRIAGAGDGYFRSDDEPAVITRIRASEAAILFVAMGSPATEHWLARHRASLGIPVVMGVGGSIDVLAGKVKRAPAVFQRLRLEWLYRLAQEPRRLIRRNLASVTFWRMALAARFRA